MQNVLIEPGEKWWGGAVSDGYRMPFATGYKLNLLGDTRSNQAQPLLLSNHGRYIWSEEPFSFQVYADSLVLKNSYPGKYNFIVGKAGKTLKEAYDYACKKIFPSTGKMPDDLMFVRPQYNTWIELVYNQNQVDVLKYAHGIIENNFPVGVIMIDDNWQEDYGKWQFHPGRFSDPKSMVDSLHHMGFKIMVWICPFISPDCDVYRKLRDEGFLIKEKTTHEPAMIHWWNGVSALLDLTNPRAMTWIKQQLSVLTDSVGIDGFKFDAGYAFTCPDLIGGGEYLSFINLKSTDQDLIVRSAQCHALMPMMQFSVAPWRVLDAEHLKAIQKAIAIRTQFIQIILSLAKASATEGEPVIRAMEYVFPNKGYDEIKDQFMLGDSNMVAPMLQRGTGSRQVVIPPGKWIGDDGKIIRGPASINVQVPIERLPYFRKVK